VRSAKPEPPARTPATSIQTDHPRHHVRRGPRRNGIADEERACRRGGSSAFNRIQSAVTAPYIGETIPAWAEVDMTRAGARRQQGGSGCGGSGGLLLGYSLRGVTAEESPDSSYVLTRNKSTTSTRSTSAVADERRQSGRCALKGGDDGRLTAVGRLRSTHRAAFAAAMPQSGHRLPPTHTARGGCRRLSRGSHSTTAAKRGRGIRWGRHWRD
jgi:hypothetical protein